MSSVYFIRCESTGAVKIGVSADPMKRLRQLQTANPGKLTILTTMPGDATTEAALHARFASKRLAGEWFNLTDEDVAAILRGDFEDISPVDVMPRKRLLKEGDRVRLTVPTIFGWTGAGTVMLDEGAQGEVITFSPDDRNCERVQAMRHQVVLLRSWSLPKPKSSIGA